MAKSNEATRFQPKPPEEKMVRTQVFLRPDQAAWLLLQESKSEVIRRALDHYRKAQAPDDIDYAAALDAMATEPSEIDEV